MKFKNKKELEEYLNVQTKNRLNELENEFYYNLLSTYENGFDLNKNGNLNE